MGKRKKIFTKMMSFRLPEDLAEAWNQAANDAGLNLTDFIRTQVHIDGVDPITPKSKSPVKRIVEYATADPKLIRQVARIGNNLNQIARFCNTHKSGADASKICRHLISIEHELKKALE